MAVLYRHPRGTKANLDTLATGSQLVVGQVYFITDENRLAVATATNSYTSMAKLSEAGGGGGVTDGDKGDITVSGTGATWTIDNNAVTLGKMAQVATATFLGRTTASTGNVEALTATQATALLNTFTASAKGLVPSPTTSTGKFLKDDGTWDTPAGGGGVTAFSDSFTGTGAQTAFTMSNSVTGAADIIVTVNGLVQIPTTHYTVSGTTLTFVTAPFNGANILARRVAGGTGATGSTPTIGVEISISAIGKPTSGQKMVRYIASRACTLDQSLSRGSAAIASTGNVFFSVKKNGTQIATFTFNGSATATVSVTNTAIVAGDVITIEAPASQDSTLEDIALTLAGSR